MHDRASKSTSKARGASAHRQLDYGPRLLAAVGAGLIAWFLHPADWSPMLRGLAAWDGAATAYLVLAWITIIRCDGKQTKALNEREDPGRSVLFVLIVLASFASFGAVGVLSNDTEGLSSGVRVVHILLTILGLLFAWLMIQTLFGFHYAHRYYGGHSQGRDDRHGLKFPGGNEPDYLDFAYYSFVVGMTSQVSDVQIVTRSMRRLTLIHGILSFVFNIGVLAMSINVIGNAIK
jgi:uncharacterized membrane protein